MSTVISIDGRNGILIMAPAMPKYQKGLNTAISVITVAIDLTF